MPDALDRTGQRWTAEEGTTLTEVLVVLALGAMIVPALALALVSGIRQERAQDTALVTETELGFVAALITADVKELWAVDDRSGTPESFLTIGSTTGARPIRVEWYVDDTALMRRVFEGDALIRTSDEVMLDRFVDNGTTFRYWASDGSEITDGDRHGACVARVSVSLAVLDMEGDEVASVFDVAHRTRDPEVDPC